MLNGRQKNGKDQTLIGRLPAAWQKLFVLLVTRSVEAAVCWFHNEAGSRYGNDLVWHHLLTFLGIRDPAIVENNLIFEPRFFHLSIRLQHKFLVFLHHVASRISSQELAKFVQVLLQEQNQSLVPVQHLVLELKKSIPASYFQTIHVDVEEAQVPDEIPTETCSNLNFEDPCPAKVTVNSEAAADVIVIDEEPPSKRPRLDAVEQDRSGDMVVDISSEEEASETISDNSKLERFQNDIDGMNMSKDKSLLPENTDNEFAAAVTVDLPDGIQKVKEIWHAGAVYELEETLKDLIVSLSDKQMEELCKFADFPEMGEDNIELVCKHICSIASRLSFGCVNMLLSYALTDRVKGLAQNASRKFMSSILLIAGAFPKQLIESVFIPCLMMTGFLPVHADILNRLIKESLNALSRSYFVEQLTRHGIKLTDGNITVFHTILDVVGQLDNQIYAELLKLLLGAVTQNSKNLKFGKLLLAFVNKHGQNLNSFAVESLKAIVGNHNTFLKKTLLAAVNKIKCKL